MMLSKFRRLLTFGFPVPSPPPGTSRVASSQSREQPRLLFIFHGRNQMLSGIAQQLYQGEEVFRETIQRCSRVVENNLGFSLSDFFAGQTVPPTDSLVEIERRNLVLTSALQLALCDLWGAKGVEPDAVLAASAGEVAAGYA